MRRNWSYQPVIVESQAQAAEALFSGQCQAFTSEHAPTEGHAVESTGRPEEYLILPDQISKEPMGPVVRRGDDEWFTIVRWVLFALIRAEETGLTQIQRAVQAGGRDRPDCGNGGSSWTGSFPRH